MELLIFISLLVFSFVQTQRLPSGTNPPPPPPLTLFDSSCPEIVSLCLSGTSNTRTGVNQFSEVQCDFSQGNSCQTKIEKKPGFLRIDRHCKQTHACRNNAIGNLPKCYPGENNVQQCYFCCESNLCNNFTLIPDFI